MWRNHKNRIRSLCRPVFVFPFYYDLAEAFLRETWLPAFFCEREGVFCIFRDAWKGQLLMRVFRRDIGDPRITVAW